MERNGKDLVVFMGWDSVIDGVVFSLIGTFE